MDDALMRVIRDALEPDGGCRITRGRGVSSPNFEPESGPEWGVKANFGVDWHLEWRCDPSRDQLRDSLDGEDAATAEHVWSDEAEMWFAGVSQANRDAATFPAAFDGVDLVSITIGEEAWFEVFPVRRPGDLDYIGEPAAAVFAGRVEEVRGGGFAQIILGDGSRVPAGTTHLPLPWKWWPDIRRYASYAGPPGNPGS